MPTKKLQNGNGKLPTAKDFEKLPDKLTAREKKRIAVTRAVLEAIEKEFYPKLPAN